MATEVYLTVTDVYVESDCKYMFINTEDINTALKYTVKQLLDSKRLDDQQYNPKQVYVHCFVEQGATPHVAPEDWKAPVDGIILKIRRK